ncbi:aldo/keto reductase family oxidoreductase [Stanieria sp. NIES-3757]|nr:aldo/keto reductase family oxidoreductase [Stanieria sp. NIES-3757]
MELITLDNFPASILGLAGNQSMEERIIQNAFAAGINYFFFYNLSFESLLSGLKPLLEKQREKILIATGSESRNQDELNQYLDRVRHRLDLDLVDVFFIEYVSPADDLAQIKSLLDELNTWKEKGLIRYVGVTVHNRAIAIKLIEDGQIDVLMHRYNMAHRKAEEDVLPAAKSADIPVIAFTCTRWGSLLKGHQDWQGTIPTAADCYRYAIANSAVRMALTAPQTSTQLDENLQLLKNPELSEVEKFLWQSYGDLIYGNGRDSFETEWL